MMRNKFPRALAAAFILSLILALALPAVSFAKTLVSAKAENIFFYATNAEDKAVLVDILTLDELSEISHGQPNGKNYTISSTDNYPTTQYCEARGITVPELVDYVKRASGIAGADALGFSGGDTIRLMATDSFGNYNRSWTYDALYSVPRYYFEGLFDAKTGWKPGWEIAGEDNSKFGLTLEDYLAKYKDSDAFYADKASVFAGGVRTEPILATQSFSGRTTSDALVASTEIGIADQIAKNGGVAAGSLKNMLEDTWSLRLSLPMTEADLMAAHRTAFDNFKWIYNLRLDMEDAPGLRSLGTIAEPAAAFSVSGDVMTISVSCETAGAKLFYSFDGAPQIPYTKPVTVDVTGRNLAQDPVTFYMTAVREGWDDAGVITAKYPGLAPQLKTTYSAMADTALTLSADDAVSDLDWLAWTQKLSSVTMKAPRDGGYKTVDKELWQADAEARTITLDKRLFTETGSHSFVFRAPSFADKSVSVTIKRTAPAINTRYGAALGAPVVFSFGSPEYQDGLTVYVTQPGRANPLMLPTSYLDRSAPGRLILRAAYFKSASCAIKEPGDYVFSFVNSKFEPGSVDFAMKFAAADIPDFDDVAAGDWYYDAARFVIAEGLFDADESFGSDSPMTRAMLAETLYRLYGAPDVSGESPFTDSGEKSVIWAYGEGIVEGAGGGLFLPENTITREQIAVMLYRYHKITPAEPFAVADAAGELSRFIDSGAVSAWAREGSAWAAQAGILRGTDNAELLPQETATRAQAAQLLFNYLLM